MLHSFLLLLNEAVKYPDNIESDDRMIDELDRIWKEASWHNRGTIQALFRRGRGKLRKPQSG
jgi:hypothetical protein